MAKKLSKKGFFNFLLSNKKHQETQIPWLAFVFLSVVVSL
jgi:hypothetical protein